MTLSSSSICIYDIEIGQHLVCIDAGGHLFFMRTGLQKEQGVRVVVVVLLECCEQFLPLIITSVSYCIVYDFPNLHPLLNVEHYYPSVYALSYLLSGYVMYL